MTNSFLVENKLHKCNTRSFLCNFSLFSILWIRLVRLILTSKKKNHVIGWYPYIASLPEILIFDSTFKHKKILTNKNKVIK